MQVIDIKDDEFMFISDSQEVNELKLNLPGLKDSSFDSFFVKIKDADYSSVYGMRGIIPYLGKNVYKIL